jgi:hypothetical protein
MKWHSTELISSRTKAALAAAKARGKKLDGDRGARLSAKARAAGRAELVKRAKARAADLMPMIGEIRQSGITSLRGIAAALNERGIPTARGEGKWSAVQVARTLALRTQSRPKPFLPPGQNNKGAILDDHDRRANPGRGSAHRRSIIR